MVNKLLQLYSNIKYIHGNISIILNAYNLVSSKSTFMREIIYFSKKLKILLGFSKIKTKKKVSLICLFQKNIEELYIHGKIHQLNMITWLMGHAKIPILKLIPKKLELFKLRKNFV